MLTVFIKFARELKSLSGIVFRSNKSLQKYFSCFEAALCGMQVIFEGLAVPFLFLMMDGRKYKTETLLNSFFFQKSNV